MSPRVVPEHALRRKKEIQSAAMRSLRKKGYDRTRVEDIVRESGLSVGAIYKYFGSKEEIFRSVAKEEHENRLARLQAVFSSSQSMEEKLSSGYGMYFELLPSLAPSGYALYLELLARIEREQGLRKQVREIFDRFMGFLERELEACQQRGEIRRDIPARTLVQVLRALFEGMELQWYVDPNSVNLPALQETIRTVLWDGLRPGDGSTE